MDLPVDPLITKALKLVHTKTDEAVEELRQMLIAAADPSSKYKKELKSGSTLKRSNTTSTEAKDSVVSKKAKIVELGDDDEEFETSLTEESLFGLTSTIAAAAESDAGGAGGISSTSRQESMDIGVVEEVVIEDEMAVTFSLSEDTDGASVDELSSEESIVEALFDCTVCGSSDEDNGNQILECQDCKRSFHQLCHEPPVSSDRYHEYQTNPRYVWYCTDCCSKNVTKVSSSTKSQSQRSSVSDGAKDSKSTSSASASTAPNSSTTTSTNDAPSATTAPAPPVFEDINIFKRISKSSSSKDIKSLSKPSLASTSSYSSFSAIKTGGSASGSSPGGSHVIGLAGLAQNLSKKSKEELFVVSDSSDEGSGGSSSGSTFTFGQKPLKKHLLSSSLDRNTPGGSNSGKGEIGVGGNDNSTVVQDSPTVKVSCRSPEKSAFTKVTKNEKTEQSESEIQLLQEIGKDIPEKRKKSLLKPITTSFRGSDNQKTSSSRELTNQKAVSSNQKAGSSGLSNQKTGFGSQGTMKRSMLEEASKKVQLLKKKAASHGSDKRPLQHYH